jgi:membrane protein required for beta-lactamase induction
MLSSRALFGISIAFSFIAWGIVLARYVWPVLRSQSRADAMQPLILLHCFRFVGLSFLVPGVVSPDLPSTWAFPASATTSSSGFAPYLLPRE